MLGKLLLAVGEDNVLWGTDAIWYGSPQPAIDAFRAFQIPADLRDRFGYPELTRDVKAKILGRNAARIYGIDLAAARAARDDLAWLRPVMDEVAARGVPESVENRGSSASAMLSCLGVIWRFRAASEAGLACFDAGRRSRSVRTRRRRVLAFLSPRSVSSSRCDSRSSSGV